MSIVSTILESAGRVKILGWLEKIPLWDNLPYTIKGTLLRALKAGLAAVVAVILTAASAGTLFPAAWQPVATLILIPLLQAVDKFIREWNIEQELEEEGNVIAVVPEEVAEENPVEPESEIPEAAEADVEPAEEPTEPEIHPAENP